MQFYLAPLEGITGYIFRSTLNKYFGDGISKYFTPFMVYHEKCIFSEKDFRDITPDNNKGMRLVPQVITAVSREYLDMEKTLMDLGYNEININLGCPSKTVVSKGRGSGMLYDTEALDRFLYEIFESKKADISVKTRIGIYDTDEFYKLLEIYNKYEMCELIIHPRLQSEYYKGSVHTDIYRYAEKESRNRLCYNGDIKDERSFIAIQSKSENTISYMIGRGAVGNPSIIRELTGGARYSAEELSDYLDELVAGYSRDFSGEIPVLYKMKEIWSYLAAMYPGHEKEIKKMQKCKHLSEYRVYEKLIIGGEK